jgi:phosphate transport system substrate-binding protein
MKPVLRLLAAAALLAVTACGQPASSISGAGATFPYPIYAKWAHAYQAESGVGLNYQSIGSGGGIAQIKARTVTFGATDKPLDAKELDAAGLAQFPTVIGGVVPVVNIPGIKAGSLVLDGPTLAAIYLGEIKSWNDPAIATLNAGVALPAQAIAVVHRSDGSGTSFIFTDYLSKMSPAWKSKVGAATAVAWPTGLGAKGNEGVAASVTQASGSIGYVEYAYASQNKLTYLRLINRTGKAVAPTAESFSAAAASADWSRAPAFNLLLTDQPGDGAWPISGATFVLVYRKPVDSAATASALKFFRWAYAHGEMAAALDYVPLPPSLVRQVEQSWQASIRDAAGKPLL